MFSIYIIGGAIINKRAISECCGRKASMGIGVEKMESEKTPPDTTNPITRPEVVV